MSQEVGDCGMLGQPMLPVLLPVSSVLLVLQAAMERATVLEVQIDWITILVLRRSRVYL